MIGRGADLNKVRRQAESRESRSKAKVSSKAIQPNIMTPSAIVPNQPTVSSGAVILEPMDNTPSLITTPQDLRNVLSPMSPVEIDNINPEPEDPESGRFLASLIAQGAAGFGAGMMGGSSQDILRATGMFDRMRESDINRQDRLGQAKLLRDERLGEKQERLAEIKKREDQAKSLTDPNSEESKRDRLLYEKVLKTKIPEEVTAFDLRNRPEIVRSLMAQAEQSRLPAMPRGGIGVGGAGKQEKTTEIDKEDVKKISAMADLNNSIDNLISSVEKHGKARFGEEALNQNDLKYSIAASSGVIKGQGSMTESDINFWDNVLSPSATGSKEDYINRMKKKKSEYVKGITKSLELKGYTVKPTADGKYSIFDKNENFVGQY